MYAYFIKLQYIKLTLHVPSLQLQGVILGPMQIDLTCASLILQEHFTI